MPEIIPPKAESKKNMCKKCIYYEFGYCSYFEDEATGTTTVCSAYEQR